MEECLLDDFILDRRLESDSDSVMQTGLCDLRLSKDARWPWLILVPRRANVTEIFELTPLDQVLLTFETEMTAAALKKVLRPDGTVLAFFTTVASADTRFSKYVIMNEDTVTQRPYSSGGRKQTSFQNRDIIRMFDGLKVAESFLLKTNVREFLFRKPT